MSLTQKIETPSITYEQPTGLFIGGKWVKSKEGKTFETINPTNEKPIVAVQEAGPDGTLQTFSHIRFLTSLTTNLLQTLMMP